MKRKQQNEISELSSEQALKRCAETSNKFKISPHIAMNRLKALRREQHERDV